MELLKKRGKRKRRSGGTYHIRGHRNINPDGEEQLNRMIDSISKDQNLTSNYTYMPLFFGTVAPAEGQLLVAGIRHNASAEEKFMLEKILSIKPETPLTSATTNVPTNVVPNLVPPLTPPTNQTHPEIKNSLNLDLNSPEVKKTLMEIMHRQQHAETYEVSYIELFSRDFKGFLLGNHQACETSSERNESSTTTTKFWSASCPTKCNSTNSECFKH